MIAFLKRLFANKKVIKLFPKDKVALAELSGNYCSDSC